jgi:hypothetical protein
VRQRRSRGLLCGAAASLTVCLCLVLAAPALAGGNWGSKSDFSHLNVQWSDDSNRAVDYTVFTLPVPVQSGTTADGRQCTVGQPGNNPNQIECPIAQMPNGTVSLVTTQAMPCSASIDHQVSEDGVSYVPQATITSRNSCTPQQCPRVQAAQVAVNCDNPPCDCATVKAFANDFGVFGAGSTRIQFVVHARLTCTPGSGAGCKGQIKVLSPKAANFVKPKNGKIVGLSCAGPCNAVTKAHATLQYVALVKKGKHTVPNPRFTQEGRANRTFKIKLSVACVSPTGVPRPGKVVTLALHFNKRGFVDYKKSDLDGDGKKDGKQLQP